MGMSWKYDQISKRANNWQQTSDCCHRK